MKKFFKNVAAVVALVAAAIVTVPALAKARTAPEKGCGVNPTGYHDYRYYCIGFSDYTETTHKHYDSFWDQLVGNDNYIICTVKYPYHGSSEKCQYCKSITGVIAKHCDNEIHMNCGKGTIDYGYCNGLGSDVTVLTQ